MPNRLRKASRAVFVIFALALPAPVHGQGTDETAKVAEGIEPSAVVVRYWLRFDRGEAPKLLSWRGDLEALVRQERPFERAGLVVAEGLVVTTDPMIHPRFVERIDVQQGGRAVGGRPFSHLERGDGIVLKLDGPLGTPLAFDAKAAPAFRSRMHSREETWGISAWRFSAVLAREEGTTFLLADTALDLVVAAEGKVIGIQFFDELPLDGSWKGSPLDLPAIPAERMKGLLAETEKLAARGLPHVSLSFRSRKAKGGGRRFAFFDREESDEDATELHAAGVVLDERRVLVLADLKPKVTARLEGILVHLPDGEPVPADFRASVKRLGAFVVEARSPLPAPHPLPAEDVREWRGKALVAAEVVVRGEERTSYVYPARFDSLRKGFRGWLHPGVEGDDENLFLFDPSGTLLALPAVRRDFAAEEQWHRPDAASLFAACHLEDALADTDPANVPLSEEEENRLAWMGVVLQPLDEELARANKVSDLTKGGDVGGLVSYVYPGSPAARSGVEPGDILLRIHAEGVPKPFDVKVDENPFADLPMDMPAEMQDQMGDEIPPPWPSAESMLARTLTDLGAGRKYEAEFVREGKLVRKPFVVEWGPTHFDSAKRFKSDALGLTVRDLTYEVRQHYQMGPEDPGVVVSKVEKGKKAAVAGVRLFEIVTQVDEKPVASSGEFGKAVEAGGEHRFTLKFKSRTRVVKIAAEK